jgi:excisionase family DNA binding protein
VDRSEKHSRKETVVGVSGSDDVLSLDEAISTLREFVQLNEEWPPPPESTRARILAPVQVALECMCWAQRERRTGRRIGLLTVEQASKALGISRGAAYRAAAVGELPTLRLGRRVYVPAARLEDLLGPCEGRAG